MKWYWAIFTACSVIGVALDFSGFVSFPGVGHSTGWVIVVLVLVSGGWMAFDGARALIVRDYVTPRSGRHAGQLGTWAKFARLVGIEPRSNLMKSVLLVYGLSYVIAMVTYASGPDWSRWVLSIAAALGLWYWPFGTIINVIVIALVWMA